MILVVGGGFGLYGHVAALAGAGREVATLSRYRAAAEARPELAHLLPRIGWVDDVMAAAREADAVVLAQTPGQNAAWARALIEQGFGGVLIIEKPVAETPVAAAALEAEMAAAGQRWAVPYLFAECSWAADVRAALTAGRTVEIDWTHRQSPAVRGWKRQSEQGGGAIAFYFIHCIALAQALLPGCVPVMELSKGADGSIIGCALTVPRHCERSEAIQGGARDSGLLRYARNDEEANLRFGFQLGDEAGFTIAIDGEAHSASATPFGPIPAAGSPDPRLPMLASFHRRVAEDPAFQPPAFHAAVTRHWAALEAAANG